MTHALLMQLIWAIGDSVITFITVSTSLLSLASSSAVAAAVKRLTRQTDVVDFKVVVKFDVARSPVSECRLHDVQRAPATPRTAAMQYIQHIDVTSDVAEVGYDAAADLHSTVDGSSNNQHLSGAMAVCVEPSVMTILPRCRRRVWRQR